MTFEDLEQDVNNLQDFFSNLLRLDANTPLYFTKSLNDMTYGIFATAILFVLLIMVRNRTQNIYALFVTLILEILIVKWHPELFLSFTQNILMILTILVGAKIVWDIMVREKE